MANLEGIPAAINQATCNAQLTALPTFSNRIQEDKWTASEWLEKVIINKNGGEWTEIQTITYFRNALRGNAVSWYNSIATLNSTREITWDLIKRNFETDFRAAPTTTSIICKLTEIKQKDSEDVNEYYNRVMPILIDLKSTFGSQTAVVLPLNAAQTLELNALAQAFKTKIFRQYREAISEQNFVQMAGYHLMAGFKPKIRADLMDSTENMGTLYAMKLAALKCELKFEEITKSPNGTNGAIGNGMEKLLAHIGVNEINEYNGPSYEDEIEAINSKWKRRQGSSQTSTNQPKCSHCHKPGHTVDKCWAKNGKPNQNQSSGKPGATDKKCTFCHMTNHTVDNCFKLLKAERIRKEQGKVNQVDEYNYSKN